MLCKYNWPVVHTTCRSIISTGMKKLKIDDPHEFDKAVLWEVVKNELDLSTKWRCICVFFLAAAMELVIEKRWKEGEFKKVAASEKESDSNNPAKKDDGAWNFFDLFKKIDDLHKKTVDLHEKHDRLHDMLKNASNNARNAQNTNTQVVHVNYSHVIPHPSQALIPVPSSVSVPQAAGPPSPADLEALMLKILQIAQAKNKNGFTTTSGPKIEPQAIFNDYT